MVKTSYHEAIGKDESIQHILKTDYSEFEDYREIYELGDQDIEAVVLFYGHDKYNKNGVVVNPQDMFLYGCFKVRDNNIIFRCSSLAILSHLYDCVDNKRNRFRLCRMSSRYGITYYIKECAENV